MTSARAFGALFGVALVAACGAPAVSSSTTSASTGGTVTVLAAASLTEPFQRIEKDYEAAHPGTDVQLSFAASSTIVAQVNGGAPADVLALAGEAAATLLKQDLVASRTLFASNTLEIAVPPTNPGAVSSLPDLARPGLKVVLCASTVPCGQAADATLAKARVSASVVSRETDVKATLAKVRLGEADAAVVYHSDVGASKGAVTGIPVPDDLNQTLRYPLISLNTKPSTSAFTAYVTTEGRKALQDNAFGMP